MFGTRPEGTFNPYSEADRDHAIRILGGAWDASTKAPEADGYNESVEQAVAEEDFSVEDIR